MTVMPTQVAAFVLVSLLALPPALGDERGGTPLLAQSTELVTAPLEGRYFRCSFVNVDKKNLGFRVQILSLFGTAPPLADDDGGGILLPPGFGWSVAVTLSSDGDAYCRIRLFGTTDKDAVRGALKATTLESSAAVEAR